MGRQEAKTGQSIDILKHGLINPTVFDSILDIPGLPTDLSIIDLGSGDATTSQDLITSLLHAGRRINNIALVDADVKIFPDLVGTITSEPFGDFNIQVVQAGKRDVVAEFLEHFTAEYDLALSQLVLHQIKNVHEASYLMYLAYRALIPTGDLLVVNLHPKYLQYLAENEPDKFEVTDRNDGETIGAYNFDSSGSASVYSRSIESQLAMFLGLGFDFVKLVPIVPDALAGDKPRYRNLTERRIPMFYLMQLRKNPVNFISSTTGAVANIKSYDSQWITVTFMNGDEIRIPRFKDWTQVNEGDHLILHEARRKESSATMLNYWIVNPAEKIRGGLLVTRK